MHQSNPIFTKPLFILKANKAAVEKNITLQQGDRLATFKIINLKY